jgi:hypothetical protein
LKSIQIAVFSTYPKRYYIFWRIIQYKCEERIPEKIWWEAHEKAIEIFVQKFIHTKLHCNYKQNQSYKYKPFVCSTCKLEIKTQDHILRCIHCPARKRLREKYCLELNLRKKYRINSTTTKIISHNIGVWFNNKDAVKTKIIAPDATKNLQLASKEDDQI